MYVGLEVQLHGLPRGDVAEVRMRVQRALGREFDPEYASDLQVGVSESAGGDYYIGRTAVKGAQRGVVIAEVTHAEKVIGLWVDLGSGRAEVWSNGDYVFDPPTTP